MRTAGKKTLLSQPRDFIHFFLYILFFVIKVIKIANIISLIQPYSCSRCLFKSYGL